MKSLHVFVSPENRQINAIELNEASASYTINLLANTIFQLTIPTGATMFRLAVPIGETVWVSNSSFSFPAAGGSSVQNAEPNPGLRILSSSDTDLYFLSSSASLMGIYFYNNTIK